MSELNKYFLQYMLTNGIIKCEEGNGLLNNLAAKINEQTKDFNAVVSQINNKISAHLFRLDIKICEVTGVKMCVLINKCVDDVGSSSASLTPAETEFFNSILTAVMNSDSKRITSIICLNLTSRLKAKMNKDNAQDKMGNWVKGGYLVKEKGFIYLGARTVSEFEMFLKVQFRDRITTCRLCRDFVYFGKICAECNEVLHSHCSTISLNRTSTCPVCKKPWREAEGRNYDEENDSNESMESD